MMTRMMMTRMLRMQRMPRMLQTAPHREPDFLEDLPTATPHIVLPAWFRRLLTNPKHFSMELDEGTYKHYVQTETGTWLRFCPEKHGGLGGFVEETPPAYRVAGARRVEWKHSAA